MQSAPSSVSAITSSDDLLMEIAHIVMGFWNEGPSEHFRMLAEIEELIASASPHSYRANVKP